MEAKCQTALIIPPRLFLYLNKYFTEEKQLMTLGALTTQVNVTNPPTEAAVCFILALNTLQWISPSKKKKKKNWTTFRF